MLSVLALCRFVLDDNFKEEHTVSIFMACIRETSQNTVARNLQREVCCYDENCLLK
jgi:hypothetical protein